MAILIVKPPLAAPPAASTQSRYLPGVIVFRELFMPSKALNTPSAVSHSSPGTAKEVETSFGGLLTRDAPGIVVEAPFSSWNTG